MSIKKGWDVDRHPICFILSICPFGGTLGFIAFLMSYMARTPPWEQPAHLPLVSSMILGIPGFMAGILASAVIARLESAEWIRPRALYVWCLWGVAYGISLPLITGALIPLFDLVLQVILGQIGLVRFLNGMIDSVFRIPWSVFIQGVIGLPSGLLMGMIFAVGSWLVDIVNSLYRSKFGILSPYFVGILLSASVLLIFYFAPVRWISQLGWGLG